MNYTKNGVVWNSSRHINYFKNRKKRYGFTLNYEEYLELMLKQKNLCAICKRPEKNKALAIDHDHKTGKTRGLLCQKCNRGLGCFEDNLLFLKRASAYLASKNSVGKL